MFKKLLLACAAVMAVGFTAGMLVGGSPAVAQKFKFECWPNFVKTGGGDSYACHLNVGNVCRAGFIRGQPTLKQIKSKIWRVQYGCTKGPK